MRAKRAFDLHPVDCLGTGPPFGRAQDDHRPHSTFPIRPVLDPRDLVQAPLQRGRHQLMHFHRVVAADDHGLVPVALHQLDELTLRDAGEHGRVSDLVTVQVKDRQHCTVAFGIDELVGVPAGRQRSGFSLAVADDAENGQLRVVERGAVRVDQRVTELASFVDRPRSLGCVVAGYPAWK